MTEKKLISSRNESSYEKDVKIATKSCNEGLLLFNSKNHNKKTHTLMLALYSKSIAFSPLNSNEFGEALCKRAALLFHVKKYKESLIDIERSLKCIVDINKKQKLLTLKDKCLQCLEHPNAAIKSPNGFNEISDYQRDILKIFKIDTKIFENSIGNSINKKLELPKIVPSEDIPCGANIVLMQNNKKYGKHLVAKSDIDAGAIIIAEESFFVFPATNKIHLVCSYCLSYAWNGIPCDSCAFAIYCSEECKNKAFEEYHDIECKIIPYYYFLCEDKILGFNKAVVRLFIKLLKKEGLDEIMHLASLKSDDYLFFKNSLSCHQFWCCFNLASHYSKDDLANNDNILFVSLIVELLENHTTIYTDKRYCKQFNLESERSRVLSFTKYLLLKLKNMLQVNSYYFQDENCNNCSQECDPSCPKRGIILAICSSLLNHSCNPNVGTVFVEKHKIVQYALRPIKAGEQLFANYGTSLSMNVKERKDILQKDYFFTCDCTPCIENWPVFDDKIAWKFISEVNPAENVIEYLIKTYLTFCDGGICPLLHSPLKWQYNFETLEHAKKMLEIMFDYLDYHCATIASVNYITYIINFYKKIFGIEYNMLDTC